MSASNGVSTPTENIAVTNGSLVHVNMTNITKLNATNYIMWRRQIHALFDGYELATYLDLSTPVPDPLITLPGTTTTTENPAHTLYKRQDKLLYSAILGAISLSIQPILSKTTTTSEIWETLASTYAKPSRGHIKQLKYQIKQWKKGTKTVDEYLLGLTTRFDQLALLGKVIDLEDQIEYVLEGLPEEYKTLIDQVEGRDSPPTLTELHEKLINQEVKIVTAEPAAHMPVSANVAINHFKPNNKNNARNQPRQSNQRHYTDTNIPTWQPRPYLGKCQICGVQGHSARRCPQLSHQPTGVLIDAQSMDPPASTATAPSSDSSPGSADSPPSNTPTSTSPNPATSSSSPAPANSERESSPSPSESPSSSASNSHQPQSPTNSVTSQAQQGPAANNPQLQPNTRHQMTTRLKNNITKPNRKYGFVTTTPPFTQVEPRTLNQALQTKHWRKSMSTEIDAQIAHRTWDLVPRTPGQNVIETKWIYRIKQLVDGSLDKYKSRLVARGFNQKQGIDFDETYSPVIKATSTRAILKVAVSKDWCLRQLDVNNAFLQGTLDEDVYVTQPPGFIDPDRPDYVCKLRKALYGLKQAPRAWYMELKRYLIQAGFRNSMADTSLFIMNQQGLLIYVLVYVDDIIVTGNKKAAVEAVITNLAQRFSVKDMGVLSYFLGIEVIRTSKGLHLNQRKYILDLLTKMNMADAKPVQTPMATSPKLTKSGAFHSNPTEYRTLIGSLQYLSFTRPDIAYVVNKLSQYMQSPTTDHWQVAKRVLRYLAGSATHGLFISKSNNLNVHGFTDADWGGDQDDYVSTNAYIVYLGNQPISWQSRKQKGVARSSTEAEYRAVANTAAEIRWVCSLLSELGIAPTATPVIYCDNIGATYLCANPVFHSRMKHIALDYHFIREQVQNGTLRVSHISTHDQLADSLTKSLDRSRFKIQRSKIGVSQAPPS